MVSALLFALAIVNPLLGADSINSPASSVKLVFIHHSTGGNWLADANEDQPYGGLGIALRNSNYFVSATNYGWGPGGIGDRTDIVNWTEWFRGSGSSTVLNALYSENQQNFGDFGSWSRMSTDPGGENRIILFKSCFPNSDLYGNPSDPPLSEPDDQYTVSNAKAVYNDLLAYFRTRQDKLFIVITAPPLRQSEYYSGDQTSAERAANARALNNWLVHDWLSGYAYKNVAVFDYYNVLTGADNHHRWYNGAVQHVISDNNNYAYYPSGDSHPSTEGHQKAAGEFIPLLNVFYNRWKAASISPVSYEQMVQKIYIGYYQRPADPAGLIWWAGTLEKSGGNLNAVIEAYANSLESQTLYGTINSGNISSVVNSIYRALFNRDADAAGRDYYVAGFNAGMFTAATIMLNVLNGAQGGDLSMINNKLTAADLFTKTIDPDLDGANFQATYGGDSDAVSARYFLSLVTASASTVPTQSQAAEYIRSYIADPGDPINSDSGLVQTSDIHYLGAFRLPGGDTRPKTFAYGGNAMTFNPDGDFSGSADGFPGSLFIMGHDRLAWGDLPDGNQVAEVSIPVPVVSSHLTNLNQAGFLQDFQNVAQGKFTSMEEVVRVGMLYLNGQATGPKIHLAWGQHFEPDTPAGTHAWFDPNLSDPDMKGPWFIGNRSFYSVNDYMMEIPASWADSYAQGRYVGTGRFRDGGWSGMGPALYAYRPWIDNSGTPASSGTHLQETALLQYESSEYNTSIEHCLNHYQHPDEWSGGAWITTSSGKTALLFAGTKSTGTKYWYGWINPSGPQHVCVEEAVVNDFTACRYADGTPCPAQDLTECDDHNEYRGWWSTRFDAQFLLYDPDDLAKVASGQLDSWEPQPYASMDVDQSLFHNPSGVETAMLGAGEQRRFRIGDVAYDRNNGLLYVLELFADGVKPVVHVWKVR